jgi:uncharacterized protein YegJ (DUF2314 family)
LLAPGCRKREAAREAASPPPVVDAPLADARPVAPRGTPVDGARVAVGSLLGPESTSDYAILLTPGRTLAEAQQAARTASPTDLTVAIGEVKIESIEREGTHGDVTGIERATDAVQISVGGPSSRAAAVQRAAVTVAQAAARGGGWIVDRWTAEAFTPAALDELRPDGPIELERWVVLQVLDDRPGTVQLETAGMARFGLPELRLRGVPEAFDSEAAALVVEAGAVLLRTASVTRDGELVVGDRTWATLWAGDGADAAIELVGAVERERHFEETPAWIAARDRARAELELLRPRFAAGIPAGERLDVKAAFDADDGETEWMWLEVTRWDGERIAGVLMNQPFGIRALRAGADVEIDLADVVDYLHIRADGTEAGGETDKLH